MDTQSRAELRSTLNQLKTKTKNSMIIKQIKLNINNNKTHNKKTKNDPSDFIPDVSAAATAKKQNSKVNGHGDKDADLDEFLNVDFNHNDNNGDVSRSSNDSTTPSRVLRSSKSKAPNVVDPVVSTQPSSSTSTDTKQDSNEVSEKISTNEPAIGKDISMNEVENNSKFLEKTKSNSEIIITKITKEMELEFELESKRPKPLRIFHHPKPKVAKINNKKEDDILEKKDEKSFNEKKVVEEVKEKVDDIVKEVEKNEENKKENDKECLNVNDHISGDNQIEAASKIEAEKGLEKDIIDVNSTVPNETVENVLNEDSKDETELILSQSKTFLRKSNKRSTRTSTPIKEIELSSDDNTNNKDSVKLNGGDHGRRRSSNKTSIGEINKDEESDDDFKARSSKKSQNENAVSKRNSSVSSATPKKSNSSIYKKNKENDKPKIKNTNEKQKRKSEKDINENEIKRSVRTSSRSTSNPFKITPKATTSSNSISETNNTQNDNEEIKTKKNSNKNNNKNKKSKKKFKRTKLALDSTSDSNEDNDNYDDNDYNCSDDDNYSSASNRTSSSKNRKTTNESNKINEITNVDTNNNEGIRRSTRVKATRGDNKNLKPIYTYEVLKDFNGNKIYVPKITGFEQKNSDLTKFRKKIEQKWYEKIFNNENNKNHNNSNNNKKKIIKTNNNVNKKTSIVDENNNKDISVDNPSIVIENDFAPLATSSVDDEANNKNNSNNIIEIVNDNVENNNNINNNYHVVNITQDNNNNNNRERKNKFSNDFLSESFDDLYDNEMYEHNNEVVDVEENFQFIPRNVVRFRELVDQKEYTELSHGVFATVIGPTEGIIRIDQLQNTITNEHDSDIHYYVQKGYITLKLNDKNILMTIGDAILIPKCNRYELFNPSKKRQAYILFKFDKL